MSAPKVTFGTIVLNGEPFIHYNLRALYPFAHEIIVVEGAVPDAASIATPDGHSTDGTLDQLRSFKAHQDPDDKLTIITAEDAGYSNGFWPGEKHEQSQAYAQQATGDYLWQVDIDEFYKPKDMQAVLEMLRTEKHITAVSFKQIQFWGGFSYIADSWYLRRYGEQFHRLFRWGPGYTYAGHRPPTVLTTDGTDTRSINWRTAYDMQKRNIFLYHYSFVFPKQVIEKSRYYNAASWNASKRTQQWAKEIFLELRHPFRVYITYDTPSWLERFQGEHPSEITCLQTDLENGQTKMALRPTEDIEALLNSAWYRIGRSGLKLLDPLERVFGRIGRWLFRFVRKPGTSLRELWHYTRYFPRKTRHQRKR